MLRKLGAQLLPILSCLYEQKRNEVTEPGII